MDSAAIQPNLVSKQSSGKILVPTAIDQEILGKCYSLRPSKFFAKKTGMVENKIFSENLDRLLAGGLTKKKLAEFFGLDKVTDRFYALFTGGEKITTREQFLKALDRCYLSCMTFGETMENLAENDNFIVFPEGAGPGLLRGFNVKHLKNPAVESAYNSAKALKGDSGEADARGLNLKSDTLDLMAYILVTKLLIEASKEGYKDANKIDLRDSLVRKRFSATIFNRFIKENLSPAHAQFDNIVRLGKQMNVFRDWAEKHNNVARTDINEFDANGTMPDGQNKLDYLLRNYEKKGKDWVIDFLKKNNGRMAEPDSNPKPAQGPTAYMFHFQIKPVKTNVA